MDGRRAAFNVIVGVVIGASLPLATALVLSRAFDHFEPLDHPFTLLFLSLACSVIGMLVNLPWSAAGPSTRAFVRGEPLQPHEESHEQFIFDAGDIGAEPGTGYGPRGSADPRGRRGNAGAAPKRYAMSRREALRELALEHNADDDAVREAYRRLAKEHHPDQANADGPEAVAEATRKFVRLREAYDVLIDED